MKSTKTRYRLHFHPGDLWSCSKVDANGRCLRSGMVYTTSGEAIRRAPR